jgi:hypothetical protein
MNAPNMKREPTPTELAVLECAQAIDRFELTLRTFSRKLDAVTAVLDKMTEREAWIDGYREHARDGLPTL